MKMAVASMEMAPGAIPRPGKVPKQRLLSPELGFLVAAELWNFSGEIVDRSVTSTERHIGNGPKTPSATEKGSVSPPLSLM
jgi:hypothetical protein